MRFSSDYELYQTISKNIKYYREQKGLTQFQLAEEAKISISYLSKIEAAGLNKSFSISVLNQIANALDVDISFFLQNQHTKEHNDTQNVDRRNEGI